MQKELLYNVHNTFQQMKADFGKIDYVIHLAAYYHFGNDWNSEYEETNIHGTENIINAAINYRVQRIIFTSSIAAMEPPQHGYSLNEKLIYTDFLTRSPLQKTFCVDLFKYYFKTAFDNSLFNLPAEILPPL